jgi:hypothetical protein
LIRQVIDSTTGHVNNVTYVRYAESARVNWALNFAKCDPEHKAQWMELMTPKSVGLILRSITTDYKFVSCHPFIWHRSICESGYASHMKVIIAFSHAYTYDELALAS